MADRPARAVRSPAPRTAKPKSAKADAAPAIKVLASNRRARHDYDIVRTLEAGIVLSGSEIKSVRAGRVSLQEAYVTVERGEGWLVAANIASWQAASYSDHDPTRRRKLLLKAKELFELGRTVQLKGMTLVPMRLYLKGGWAKLEVGVGRGKKLYDKRDTLKERDAARDMARATARVDR